MADPSDPGSAPTLIATEVGSPPIEKEGNVVQKTTAPDERAPLIAGRYEILGMLGAGAMGTVYRARDRELDEIVAMKVLKKELAASSDMHERFRREVKLARRVTHRNVARTFDIGEHDGDRFLTMEYVEGEGLGGVLARKRKLPPLEVIAIAIDVCEGLAAAHEAGVVHRDLKPENVVIAKNGHAVITDFGIARALESEAGGRSVAGFVGTPQYMAPEQVEGAADLDARADLYALGVMLFELLTGQTPWPGETVVAVAAARLLKPPPDPRTLAPNLPSTLSEVVLKLMARHREDRFASASETVRALEAARPAPGQTTAVMHGAPAPAPSSPDMRTVMGGAHTLTTKTLAVLPLLNIGPAEDSYIADGVGEDLVDLLSVVPGLRVRPRGQSARYTEPGRDVREVGRSLDVDVVVDGSVRRAGDAIRVSVRLVTVADGFQLWARRFDCTSANVLSVADEAGSAIARALTASAAPARAALDPAAQELFMRGRAILKRSWVEDSLESVQLLKEAYLRAPNDARVAGTYAMSLARVYGNGSTIDSPTGIEAREVAARGLELDPEQPEARVAVGLCHIHRAEYVEAMSELVRALELAPNNVDALDGVGRLLSEIGRIEEGTRLLMRATAIEPDLSQARITVARGRALFGDFDGAIDVSGPQPTETGDVPSWFFTRARFAMWSGNLDDARRLDTAFSALTLSPQATAAVRAILAIALSRSADDARRGAQLLPISTSMPRRASYFLQLRVEAFLAGGLVDEAREAFRDVDRAGLIDIDWVDHLNLLAPLRGTPEYAAVRARTAERAARVSATVDPRRLLRPAARF